MIDTMPSKKKPAPPEQMGIPLRKKVETNLPPALAKEIQDYENSLGFKLNITNVALAALRLWLDQQKEKSE